MKDEAARQRIRHDFDATLVVEAAAGTGKTTELVRRIAGLLRSGCAELDRIVAVTFTDKAAGEMKLRLRAQLEQEREDVLRAGEPSAAIERARLDAALEALETAHIGTIHAFCLDLLRERPVQARVDPAFEVIADSLPLLERAFDAWYERTLDAPPEALLRALAQRRWGDSSPRDMLLSAAEALCERRDFSAAWRAPDYDRHGLIDALVAEIAELGALAAASSQARDPLVLALRAFARFSETVATREAVAPRDHHQLEYELGKLLRADIWKRKGSGKQLAPGVLRADVLERRTALQARLERFVALADADLAAGLQRALLEVVRGYQALKDKSGALDYLDMLLCVRDMLRRDAGMRAELGRRFSHLFVDEFQDTDPLQAEILLLIASDDPAVDRYEDVTPAPGKLFVVGDPKQAIYRFRRADVVLYQKVKQQLCDAGAEVLQLTTSFRSLPAIQAAVNVAFEPVMRGPGHGQGAAWQADYVPLDRFREARAGQPAVVALPVPDPYSAYGNLSNEAIRDSEPDAVAAFIDHLVHDSGWLVEERRGDRSVLVPIEARHICLLFKARFATRRYVTELEARRIPHVLVGGRGYHDREEIIALRAAVAAIEWPDDELSVYATVRGPFFSIGDDALLAYRSQHGRLRPFAADDSEVGSALEVIAKLHRSRNRRPIAATIAALFRETRAHAGIAIWPTGEQALANLLRAMDDARQFEHGGATSFRAFVDRLERQERRGEMDEAPVLEEGTDGVRIMTVHGAKGLEFPVVILCDACWPLHGRQPSRWVDPAAGLWAFSLAGCAPLDLTEHAAEVLAQDAAEGVRVSYVAATRARDLLVVPTVGDAKRSGWLEVLHGAVYPPHAAQREAVPAPGCPRFGGDSVRFRPHNAAAQPEHSVMPGLHRGCAGGHGVVWWDPRALRLDVRPLGGLRQTELLEQDVSAEHNDARHRRWREARSEAIARASRPSLSARTVTALAQVTAADREVRVETSDAAREGRPRGARFGSLVHEVLAIVPFDADRQVIDALTAAHALMLGAGDDERQHAALAVEAALRHPLVRRAAASPCRRESPVVMRLDDGSFAEGVVDLAFCEGGLWHVVDYKTDAGDEAFASYAAQVALYARAIGAATGSPTRAYLLRV